MSETNSIRIGDRVEAEDRYGRFIVGRIVKVGPGGFVTIHDEDSHKHYAVEPSRCKPLGESRATPVDPQRLDGLIELLVDAVLREIDEEESDRDA